MTAIKFIFVLLILVPIVILMFSLFSNLSGEFGNLVDKMKNSANQNVPKAEPQRTPQREYMGGNPQYEAYRKKMEQRKALEREEEQKADLSKRKRRKQRRNKRKERER